MQLQIEFVDKAIAEFDDYQKIDDTKIKSIDEHDEYELSEFATAYNKAYDDCKEAMDDIDGWNYLKNVKEDSDFDDCEYCMAEDKKEEKSCCCVWKCGVEWCWSEEESKASAIESTYEYVKEVYDALIEAYGNLTVKCEKYFATADAETEGFECDGTTHIEDDGGSTDPDGNGDDDENQNGGETGGTDGDNSDSSN